MMERMQFDKHTHWGQNRKIGPNFLRLFYQTIGQRAIRYTVTAMLTFISSIAYSVYISDVAHSDMDHSSAAIIIPACDKLRVNQTTIETHITNNLSGNAIQFNHTALTPTTSDYTQILGTTPANIYYTSGCPTINLELGNNHVAENGYRLFPLDQVKIKKVATCSNSTGEILKWTGYTNINPYIIRLAKTQAYCLDLLYDENITLE